MEELVRICNQKRVLGETEKAICVDIGRTFDGQPITTWYPKSACQIKPTQTGYELWAPAWMSRKRSCVIGKFNGNTRPGFLPATDFFVSHF